MALGNPALQIRTEPPGTATQATPVSAVRRFAFEQDTFAFPNELVWAYQIDLATGKATPYRRDHRPPMPIVVSFWPVRCGSSSTMPASTRRNRRSTMRPIIGSCAG